MQLFADSWKRIDRAVVHAKVFKATWESLVNPNTYKTAIEMNSDWTGGVAKFIHAPIAENDLPLELGEMFYQLRSALDAAVYKASIIAQSTDPPAHEDRVEFPICVRSERFKRSTVNLPPFPQELRDWIETIQPYNAAKTENTDDAFLNPILTLLHDCARKDRHRRLHLIAAVPTFFEYRLHLDPPGIGVVTFMQPLSANLFEGKDEFLRFGVAGFDSRTPGKIRLDSDVMIEVSIDEIPRTNPGSSSKLLDAIFVAVHTVVQRFEDWHH